MSSSFSTFFYFISTCTGNLLFLQGFCPIFNTCKESNRKETHAITHQQRMTFIFNVMLSNGSFTVNESERENEFFLSSLSLLNVNIKLESL